MGSEPRRIQQYQQDLAKKAELGASQQDHYRMYWDFSSLYSTKLRTYLNYKEIPYKLMQLTFDEFTEELPELVGMSIFPVMLTPDNKVMQDTTPIMEWFEGQYPEKSAIPEDSRLAWLMWLIEEFSDEYCPRISMRTRWGTESSQRTLSGRIARRLTLGQTSEMNKLAAQMIRERQSGFDAPLGIAREQDRESVDQQLLDLLKILDEHLSEYGYLLGDRPSLADFALAGPLYGHGFNDPWSAEILEVNAPQVCNWLQEMANLGDNRGCLGRETFGDWLDLEQGLPDTLVQLVAFIAKTYLPQAQGYRDAMLSGEKQFTATIYGVETPLPRFDYRAGTFAQLQARYQSLGEGERAWLSTALATTELLPALMEGGIQPNPHFEKLTQPFVTDPVQNRLAYKGGSAQS